MFVGGFREGLGVRGLESVGHRVMKEGKGQRMRVRGFEEPALRPLHSQSRALIARMAAQGLPGPTAGRRLARAPYLVCVQRAGRAAQEHCNVQQERAGARTHDGWAHMGLTDRPASSCERYRLLCALASCREWPGTLQRAPFAAAPHQHTRGRRRAARPIACTTAPHRLPTRPTVSDAR